MKHVLWGAALVALSTVAHAGTVFSTDFEGPLPAVL